MTRREWLAAGLGDEADGKTTPLIDLIHRLMHLWKAGDVIKVDDYLDSRALRRNSIFIQLLQALIELSQAGSEERSILEGLSNHVAARGFDYIYMRFSFDDGEADPRSSRFR